MKFLTIENHPNDSRAKIKDDEICQTLSSRMGTGGGNVPLVMVIEDELQEDQKSAVKRRLRDMDRK